MTFCHNTVIFRVLNRVVRSNNERKQHVKKDGINIDERSNINSSIWR